MKKIFLLLFLTFTSNCFTQSITRGPDTGEIYFLGPTHTTNGLYYSTDFGETAVCVDSTSNFASIAADKTPGGIYYFSYPSSLYYSDNYGNTNSWVFKFSGTGLSTLLMSGIEEGHIFSGCYMHSEDYGTNFINHTCNGFFGSINRVCLDNMYENIGYVTSTKVTVADTIYLFKTEDKFENVNLIHKFNYMWYEAIGFTRGYFTGEIYMFNLSRNNLWISYDYFNNLHFVDTFNTSSYSGFGIEGGNTEGEFYILYKFINLMWQNAHIYIYYSTDYGKTFEVFHPFSKGNEPVLANFSTINKEMYITDPVEFSNFSIGDIQEYQWDFENDGAIDSYEEFPVHIYQDTGWYSVKLSVVGPDSTNSFIKENYIHIIDTTTDVRENESYLDKLEIFPNPFSSALTIRFNEIDKVNNQVKIYNYNGENINVLTSNTQSIIWNGYNRNGQKCNPGIYYIKANNSNSIHKVILTH